MTLTFRSKKFFVQHSRLSMLKTKMYVIEKKYLTEIKSITGNVVNDGEILELGKLKETEFTKKIQNLYLKKKSSRIRRKCIY